MLIPTLERDRALAVVRAPRVDDPAALCRALAAGGIRTVEFTFTTPGVEAVIAEAVRGADDVIVGAGTVTDARSAEAAVAAGAQFLVTPGISEGAAGVAREAGIPILLGALTPSEVMRALAFGAAAVKIFPAGLVGPAYLTDLRGPFPGVPVVPSGGLDAANAADWMRAGALAVTAGSSVVGAALVEAADWATVTARAREFSTAALSA
ncbi:2-dehydro-3-deoxyphosphogluconate aldolase / (4S)-4-hydroxy-2-oxoglutarate aldolase [Leifsonia sp. 98AMF]|uniref:bifunctional 4-hydroxy-2-oxoglutarate aldolase/2-dehydro-3-deoxy-phosphogluconate aldolase n=1 Tax=unclassified Leifsonia TaxID=2663824 RepID=UPI000879F782|nr:MULTISPECIES: bifunctional 4-hydroxy-2-oxoglutarate aldolase/2-dehydro-3-deoxy-phosphogluconate aldolase [unclassified Leifsonia]SDH08891.1 2-dehydro-3-deoxyphosphogluconate aldolase / (4S)-4-hydroxy-2-oxoglutarate aldolase [Leifsonia sp. 197AMF]SDJ30709.1 2-dehydro-3-deoxyphosphogluconate aldolase / (4S)-4-hydroxy-2-oxoglutarate aldolase [Leifsonia sp. 466MF]SDK49535.1 2-dehydro-3-deoxyphosphogluconate aldolase / (4S)-4-hydroxy-2-oxoglutarate aldolase [Leifsonia sp. 157MF]SDN52267.1 2-dehyd